MTVPELAAFRAEVRQELGSWEAAGHPGVYRFAAADLMACGADGAPPFAIVSSLDNDDSVGRCCAPVPALHCMHMWALLLALLLDPSPKARALIAQEPAETVQPFKRQA